MGGNSSVGRAQPCQGWGREFESRFPLHILGDYTRLLINQFLLYPKPDFLLVLPWSRKLDGYITLAQLKVFN